MDVIAQFSQIPRSQLARWVLVRANGSPARVSTSQIPAKLVAGMTTSGTGNRNRRDGGGWHRKPKLFLLDYRRRTLGIKERAYCTLPVAHICLHRPRHASLDNEYLVLSDHH